MNGSLSSFSVFFIKWGINVLYYDFCCGKYRSMFCFIFTFEEKESLGRKSNSLINLSSGS